MHKYLDSFQLLMSSSAGYLVYTDIVIETVTSGARVIANIANIANLRYDNDLPKKNVRYRTVGTTNCNY